LVTSPDWALDAPVRARGRLSARQPPCHQPGSVARACRTALRVGRLPLPPP